MFSVLSTLRSLLRLIVGRRRKDTIQSETAANITRSGTPEGSKVMSGGFDMKGEIAKLAERIVEPVAAKLGHENWTMWQARYAAPSNNSTPSALPPTSTSRVWQPTSLSPFGLRSVTRISLEWSIGLEALWLGSAEATGSKT